MEKIVTAKKPWKCDHCGFTIRPGEKYQFLSGRGPNFDEHDNQNGIEYWASHLCFDDSACIARYDKANNKQVQQTSC